MKDSEKHILSATTIVIFGGTGDLSKKKLFSAFLDLYKGGFLPTEFRIVGLSRRDLSHDEYRAFVRNVIREKKHHHTEETVDNFLKRVFYIKGDLEDIESYHEVGKYLDTFDKELGSCPNRLFYLAIPPKFYKGTFSKLSQSGIGKENPENWVRILVEKPFGSDSESAQELDKLLGSLFKEEQIYRIDHYLAKEAVQNILTFRFANSLFERSWNRDSIESVHIKLLEDIGVEKRAAFYDGIGALRDVGQNHMLQVLALVAMDNPGVLEAGALRAGRAEVLSDLRLYDKAEVGERIIRGQYRGYNDIEGIPKDSSTETYFALKVELENDRWKGVPFLLESGKRLAEAKVEVRVLFKPSESCICDGGDLSVYQNEVTIGISPVQTVDIRFWGKKPGLTYELEPRDLHFTCKENSAGLSDAYEKVLYDAIVGDQTLFTSTKEVEASWRFITPILSNLESIPLLRYSPGSGGPERRIEFLSEGRI